MIYKQIPQYPAYEVSQCGTIVRRILNSKTAKQSIQLVKGKPSGYMYCTLIWNENNSYLFPMKRISVHRLVAYAWLDKPLTNKHIWINHKDGNKANNHVDNLEWTTISENIQHKFDTGLQVMPKGKDHWLFGKKVSNETKRKMAQAKQGKLHPKFKGYYFCNFKRYDSANQAGRELNLPPKTVLNRCKNENFRLKGWYFLPV